MRVMPGAMRCGNSRSTIKSGADALWQEQKHDKVRGGCVVTAAEEKNGGFQYDTIWNRRLAGYYRG